MTILQNMAIKSIKNGSVPHTLQVTTGGAPIVNLRKGSFDIAKSDSKINFQIEIEKIFEILFELSVA